MLCDSSLRVDLLLEAQRMFNATGYKCYTLPEFQVCPFYYVFIYFSLLSNLLAHLSINCRGCVFRGVGGTHVIRKIL